MIKRICFLVLIIFFFIGTVNDVFSVGERLGITDKELLERFNSMDVKIARIEAGQNSLQNQINGLQNQINGLQNQIDGLRNLIIGGFGILLSGMFVLMGFVLSDFCKERVYGHY